MKIFRNTQGFAHPLLLIVVLVGLVGLIGYTSRQVISRNNAKQQTVTSQTPILISADDTGSQSDEKTLQVDHTGSAASEGQQQSDTPSSGSAATLPAKKQLTTKYDVSTPLGSLSQGIYEAKTGHYSNALYFVTPRLMFRVYDSVKAANLSDFARLCQNNSACQMFRITDVSINKDHITESDCYGESYEVECRRLSTKFSLKDGKIQTEYYKTVGYGHHTVSVYMLRFNGSSQWVADKVIVNLDNEGGRSSYTL